MYYEVKKDFPFYVGLKTLEVFWRYRLDRPHFGLFAAIWNATIHLAIMVVAIISPLIHLIMVARVYEELGMSENIADIVGSVGFSLVYYKMTPQYHRYNAIFRRLVAHTKFGEPKTFDEVTKQCRLRASFLVVFVMAGMCLYASTAAYENIAGPCGPLQQQTDQNLYCYTFTPFWLPININQKLIFLVQFSVYIVTYTPGGQAYILICESVLLLTSHVDSLLDHISAASYEKDLKTRSSMLRFCVKYHIHILEMAEEISLLHETFTGHMSIIWACILGSTCNQIFGSKPIGAVLYLTGFLLVCCYFVVVGQTLLNKSEDVCDILYNYPWYLESIEDQKIIMFMIKRAQIPMKLTAAPFGNYDYRFFVMVIKTAYSYLTLLRQKT